MTDAATAAGEPDFLHGQSREAKVQRASAAPLRSTHVNNEGFRLLALQIQRLLSDSVRRSIVVISAGSGEGRSTTAAGLATALSKLSPPVVLIDADPEGSGLSGLVPDASSDAADGGGMSKAPLTVVHPRPHPGSPETFIDTVEDTMHEALDAGATVIIDAPACMSSSAAFHFAAISTGVLYVTRRQRTQDGSVHGDIGAQLELLGARVLGVVVNEA